MQQIILASQSPRRKQLLEWAELPFTVIVSDTDETYPDGLTSGEIAIHIARNKALAVQATIVAKKYDSLANAPILAADTIVVLNNRIIGKPTGILFASWVATRLGARLPTGASWATIGGVACLAGIGFTMSLFVSGLAFPAGELLAQAKLGIVTASLIAGVLGALAVWLTTAPRRQGTSTASASAATP